MKLLVINGPNLNLLGKREPHIYGAQTYADLERYIYDAAEEIGVEVELFQSNWEGAIIDAIQNAALTADGIVINAAAYSHTSIAILDALKAVALPTVEVHLSDISKREPFRHLSYPGMAALKSICGQGFAGYKAALQFLAESLARS